MRHKTNNPDSTLHETKTERAHAHDNTTDGAAASGMSREFRKFLADMEDLISMTSADAGSDFVHGRERFNEHVTQAQESVEALGAAVDEHTRKTVAATNDYVHESPWMAIGIGAAAGLLLGMVLSRRS
jgi:ElaB/YqjD/DUF883 family membrane-anchored ribosome-binding protein